MEEIDEETKRKIQLFHELKFGIGITEKDLIKKADTEATCHLYSINKDFNGYECNKLFTEDHYKFKSKKDDIKLVLSEFFNLDSYPDNLVIYLVSRKMSHEKELSINDDFTVPSYKARVPLMNERIEEMEKIACYIPENNCIAIWVDILLEQCGDCDFKSFLKFVFAHELTHAMMHVDNEPSERDAYSVYSEESLANGNALRFMKEHGCTEMKELCDFVSNQPEPYQLGLYYQDAALINVAMENWKRAKKYHTPKDVTKESWFKKYASIGYPDDSMLNEIVKIEGKLSQA